MSFAEVNEERRALLPGRVHYRREVRTIQRIAHFEPQECLALQVRRVSLPADDEGDSRTRMASSEAGTIDLEARFAGIPGGRREDARPASCRPLGFFAARRSLRSNSVIRFLRCRPISGRERLRRKHPANGVLAPQAPHRLRCRFTSCKTFSRHRLRMCFRSQAKSSSILAALTIKRNS